MLVSMELNRKCKQFNVFGIYNVSGGATMAMKNSKLFHQKFESAYNRCISIKYIMKQKKEQALYIVL